MSNLTKRRRIMVTGVSGFVGTHLLSALRNKDYDFTITGRDRCSIPLNWPGDFVAVGSINGKTDWQPALSGVNTVIHLAARAHKLCDTATDSEQAFQEVNAEGTANLVRQAVAAGVEHFIFISSIGAMATLSSHHLTENTPCSPDTPYGRSKLAAEKALIEIALSSRMNWTILRPALVYGPQNPGNMERLIKLVETGLPLPFGTIRNRRSLIYVGNLVDIILHVLTHSGAHNEVFLCSDNQDLSTPDLIREIARAAEKPCRLISVPQSILKLCGKIGDHVQAISGRNISFNSATLERMTGSLTLDTQKLQTKLDWTPPYSVEAGLRDLFDQQNSMVRVTSEIGPKTTKEAST